MEKYNEIPKKVYEKEMKRLQIELIKLQEWIKDNNKKVVVVFEGRDAAGKGGTIKRITQKLNSRLCKVAALPVPTERERSQWYFQRFVSHFPSDGEMVIFDRSWYNRAGVEKVMGFCTEGEYRQFLKDCPKFEEMIISGGIILIKYWFSVSREEQLKRLNNRNEDITKRWKLGSIDIASINKWDEYSEARDIMLENTDTDESPWYIVEADNKKHARINCITHLLKQFNYDDAAYPKKEMPKAENEKYKGEYKDKRLVKDVASELN
ncbi:MAG: polyphosphate kinase 2 [Clostridia bacterium]|nr:polyphosphate kinase 2 [Clostridia bacterium]